LLKLAETVLACAVSGRFKATHLQAVWPNLECIIHGGLPVTPFIDELKALAGPGVRFHEVYQACEGIIAAQDADATDGLRLLTDVAIFYEFVPVADYDPNALVSLGEKTMPLEAVQLNVYYVLLMTSPAGLCRYVLGDVVRFISVRPPRLVHVGRTPV